MTTTRESAPDALSPAETPQGTRDQQWRARLNAAVAGERSAAAWIRAQRRAERTGTLGVARKASLDAELPGWDTSPLARWMEAATDLVDYEDLNGALPTAAGNAESRRLSRWLAYQQNRHAAGKLPKDRIKWLDKKLPGWATAKAGTRG